jgi:leucyl-tRNA synthetase
VVTSDYAFTNFLKDKAECLPSKYFDKDISEAAFGSKDGFS